MAVVRGNCHDLHLRSQLFRCWWVLSFDVLRSNLEVEIHAKTGIDCENWVEALGRCVKSLKREDDSVFASSPERAIQSQDSLRDLYAVDSNLELVQAINGADVEDGNTSGQSKIKMLQWLM